MAIHQAVNDSAWDAAEGLLRRFLQLVPRAPVEVWDTLAYGLLMQGDFDGCLAVLLPRRQDPARSFWLEHKLGDGYRGLNQLTEAEACYRRSLADGSDSPITCRNLLQVIDALDTQRAVAELHSWQQAEAPPSAGAWEGARQAAVLVPGLTLAETLWRAGHADGACRRRLLEAACYALDPGQVQALLTAAQESTTGLSDWERALQQRIHSFGLLEPRSGATTSDRGAGARCR